MFHCGEHSAYAKNNLIPRHIRFKESPQLQHLRKLPRASLNRAWILQQNKPFSFSSQGSSRVYLSTDYRVSDTIDGSSASRPAFIFFRFSGSVLTANVGTLRL